MSDPSSPSGAGAGDALGRSRRQDPAARATPRNEVEHLTPVPPLARDALRASERGDRALASRYATTTRAVAPEQAEPTDPTELALVQALAEHGVLKRAAEAIGISARTATRMAQRSPAVASALARARGRAVLSLESVAWAVAAGDTPAEEVELVQVDEDGTERVAWRRQTYRRDPRLLELLLRQHGGEAWRADAQRVQVEHRKRIVLELDGGGSTAEPPGEPGIEDGPSVPAT